MPSIIHLRTIWKHTITNNKLEDMTDLLIYDLSKFTPLGTLCHYKESADAKETIMRPTSEGTLQPLHVHTTSHSQV